MNIGFYDAYKINNELYFSSCSFNGLFKLNLLSGEVTHLGNFKDELLGESYLHGSTIGYDGRIYFIPFNAKGISMYDIESDRFLFQQMSKCRYGVPMEYQENIIIVPSNLKDNILSLNKEKKEFEVNRVLSDKVHQLVKDIGVATCDLNGSLILENQLYIGVFGESIILKINLINYKTERIFVNGISIGNMIIFNNSIWIVSDLGKTVWCISKRGEITSEYKVGKEEPIRNFQCFCEFNNELYLLGCEEDNMLKYINGKWESIISKAENIVFVEDEISTGKTIMNFINALKTQKKVSDNIRFSACSILNGMTEECENELRKQGVNFFYLVKHRVSADSDEVYSFNPVIRSRKTGYDFSEIKIIGKINPRFGSETAEYITACSSLADKISEMISTEGKNVAVIGTEECMYPAIKTAHKLNRAASVVTHSTTRSPVVAENSKDYPLKSRYQVESFYDKARKTFIYNSDINRYDLVLIVTDSEKDDYDFSSFADAFPLSEKFILVRWVK